MSSDPSGRGQHLGVAEIFWRAAGIPSPERTAEAVVRQALISIGAFEEGSVVSSKTGKPMTLMELLADLGIEENLVYASPELARGESIDERSLVFTIGVLMFERLTERHPFGTADNPERVARIRRCEMGSGVNFFPSVPKELRNILMRCMGPFPEERYHGLEPLKTDLARFVGQPQLAAAPAKGAAKLPKFFDAPTRVSAPPEMEIDDRFGRDEGESEQGYPTPVQHETPGRGEAPGTPARGIAARLASLAAPVPPAPSTAAPASSAPARAPTRPRVAPPATPAAPPAPAPRASEPEAARDPFDDRHLAGLPEPAEADYLPAAAGLPASLLMEQRPQRSPYSLGPWAPVIYGLLGAGIASLVFVIIALGHGNKRRARPAATGSAPAVLAQATPTRTPRVEPRPQPKPEPPPAKPEPKQEPAPESKEEVASPRPAAPPSSEAPEIEAGRLIAETIRACRVGEGGARSFRVAAYVQPEGKVVRALANTKQGLSERQVACIRREVAPLDLKLKLDKLTYIEWALRIFPDRVEARVAAPPDIKARVHGR